MTALIQQASGEQHIPPLAPDDRGMTAIAFTDALDADDLLDADELLDDVDAALLDSDADTDDVDDSDDDSLDAITSTREMRDMVGHLIDGLKLDPLTPSEQIRVGREKQLYAGLRERVLEILRERGSKQEFDEDVYLQLVSELPYEERRQLCASETAFWRMYHANLRLVWDNAKSMGPREALDERFQEGCIGLLRAVAKFDPERGFRFSTYARWWIRMEIRRQYGRSSLVRLPEGVRKSLTELRKARESFVAVHDRPPTDRELAKVMKITVAKVRELTSYDIQVSSLDTPVGDEDGSSLVDLVASTAESDDPATVVATALMCNAAHELIDRILTPAERQVFLLRLGITGRDERTHRESEMPFEQLASHLGVSRDRVHKLLESAWMKVHAAAAAADLA